jgi:hypothetical protein
MNGWMDGWKGVSSVESEFESEREREREATASCCSGGSSGLNEEECASCLELGGKNSLNILLFN